MLIMLTPDTAVERKKESVSSRIMITRADFSPRGENGKKKRRFFDAIALWYSDQSLSLSRQTIYAELMLGGDQH